MRRGEAFRAGAVLWMTLSLACKPSPPSHSPNNPSGSGTPAGKGRAGGGQNPPSECACVEYPFPPQCDKQCGMTEYIVKNVNAANHTVEVAPRDRPAEVRTIPLDSLQPGQVPNLEAGSQIQVLFKKTNSAQLAMKPLRIMKVQPSK